jgi:hypothetical protein
VMVTPRWLKTPVQPIAVENVLCYLAECLNKKETIGHVFDIGGSDVVHYRTLMEIYQEEAGLPKRWIIPVPVLTPKLSSYWIHLVTPVSAAVARPLAEGLRNPVVCKDRRILQLIPQRLFTCREAIRQALAFDALGHALRDSTSKRIPPVSAVYPGDPKWAGGTLFCDQRKTQTQASGASIWSVVAAIGGQNGWYHANWLWTVRGFFDEMVGGVGLRRGRQHELKKESSLDFWNVLDMKENQRLVLLAEMKLPGTAVLEFRILDSGDMRTIQQTAYFKPKGLLGIFYWFVLWPFHQYVFSGLLNAIRNRSEKKSLNMT